MFCAIPWVAVMEVLKRAWVGVRAALGVPARDMPSLPAEGGGRASYPSVPGVDRRAYLESRLQGGVVRAGNGSAAQGSATGVGDGPTVGAMVAGRDAIVAEHVTIEWAGDIEGIPVAGSVEFSGLPAAAGGAWAPRELRRLLFDTMTGDRLDDVAFDYFPIAYQSYTAGMSFGDKVRRLVSVAMVDAEVPYLLAAVQEVNPRGFDKFLAGRSLRAAGNSDGGV